MPLTRVHVIRIADPMAWCEMPAAQEGGGAVPGEVGARSNQTASPPAPASQPTSASQPAHQRQPASPPAPASQPAHQRQPASQPAHQRQPASQPSPAPTPEHARIFPARAVNDSAGQAPPRNAASTYSAVSGSPAGPWVTRIAKPAASSTGMPSSSAFASFEPAPGPAAT